MLQFQRIRVVSDLIVLKTCSHFPGLAISGCVSECDDYAVWFPYPVTSLVLVSDKRP